MKQILLIKMMLGLAMVSFAREAQPLDTLYANEKMNLALFFPSEIRQGIVGADNFVFSYNKDKGQSLGLLKASKGTLSNLLVITSDGNVYSYIIQYAEVLNELNRFVTLSERIGDENKGELLISPERDSIPSLAIHAASIPKDSIQIERKKYSPQFLQKSCATLLQRPERRNILKRKDEISLGIKNLVYYEDLVFLQLELKNDSGIDYEIDDLKVAVVSGNDKRKASFQSIPLTPQYVFKMPNKISHGKTSRFVYILPKFTLGDNEKLELSLSEIKGNRELVLRRKL